jgi:MEDS: MEthanogen/methylotroph, DcmR Sensory domain
VRRSHDGYRHEAVLWRGNDQFVAGTAPFVREGLAAGQPVMAALTPARIDLLRDALGADPGRVEFVDMARLGANPARIIPAWRRFTAEHAEGRQPVRGIGEPIWHGRRGAQVAECQVHETLLNMAVDPDTPLWLPCPYDAEALSQDVLAEAYRSHPVVVLVEAHRGSTAYGGAHHIGVMFEADLPAVDVVVSQRVFGDEDYSVVRTDVAAHATSAGLSRARADDLVLAVHEVAVNSVEHDGGTASCGSGSRTKRWSARSVARAGSSTRWSGGGCHRGSRCGVEGCGWPTSCATWCRSVPASLARRCACTRGSSCRRPSPQGLEAALRRLSMQP